MFQGKRVKKEKIYPVVKDLVDKGITNVTMFGESICKSRKQTGRYIKDMSMKDKQKRNPTVAIEEATYQKVKNKAKEKGLTLVDYVNETLLLNVEKDNFLKNYAPYIEKISVGETLVLRDHKTGKLAEVYLKNNKMFCSQDEADDCIHIHFALALPELALLKKRTR